MVARLAWAPPPWREVRAGLAVIAVIAALVAFGVWTDWARAPVGPSVRTTARIVSVTFVPGGKTTSAAWSIEAEFAEGKRAFFSLIWERPHQCKVGQEIEIFVTPTRIGKPAMAIGPKGCG